MQKPQITDIPPRAAKYYQKTPHTTVPPVMEPPIPPACNRFIFPFAIGIFWPIGMLLLWALAAGPFSIWIEDQWPYGDAATAQITANCGHGGVRRLYRLVCNR